MTAIAKSNCVQVGRGYSVEFRLKYNAEGLVMIGAEWSPRLPKPKTLSALISCDAYQAALTAFVAFVKVEPGVNT